MNKYVLLKLEKTLYIHSNCTFFSYNSTKNKQIFF